MLLNSCRDIRALGSTSIELCYVAAGRLDVYAQIGPKEWDVAAGSLIVKEAGGIVCDWDGDEKYDWHNHRVLAVANKTLKKQAVELFSSIDFKGT